MKKNFIFSLILLTNSFVQANVFPVFSSDGTKVNLIVQGEDSDAKNLYDSLLIEPVEENGTYTKSVIAPSSNGPVTNIYELKCKKSILVENLGSCTLSIDSDYSWATVNKENNSASVFSYGVIDTYIAYTPFIIQNNNDIIFQSIDNSLVIAVMKDSIGDIFRFRIQYNEL